MYQKIYDIVEKNGRVKTGILLNGENAGLKYLAEEDYFECSGTSENALLQNEKTILKNAVSQAAGTGVMKAGEQEIFVETYEKNPRLIILGGGHVSQPVAEIGRLLGFHITVMDDRADFFTKEIITDERLREREKGPDGNNYGMFQKRWADHDYHEDGGESIAMV